MRVVHVEERDGGTILLVTLNRPDAGNAIDHELATGLVELADRVESAQGLSAVVLTGAGRMFCAGGDVRLFREELEQSDSGALSEALDGLASQVHESIQRLAQSGVMLVAAVNGPATGAGVGLVSMCDLAYALPGATLRAGFSALGLSPDSGTTYYLPRILGYRKALEFLLSGESLAADMGCKLGLYNDVLENGSPEAFVTSVLERVRTMLAAGPQAVTKTRQLLACSGASTIGDQLDREQAALVGIAATEDGQARVRSVLDSLKR